DRLVDDVERLVGVQDRERDALGLDGALRLELGREHELLAGRDERPRPRRLARERQTALVDPALQAAARELGQQRRRGLIEPRARELGRHDRAALYAFHGSQSAAAAGAASEAAGNFRLYCGVKTPVTGSPPRQA